MFSIATGRQLINEWFSNLEKSKEAEQNIGSLIKKNLNVEAAQVRTQLYFSLYNFHSINFQ